MLTGRGWPSNVQEKVTSMLTNMATLEGSATMRGGAVDTNKRNIVPFNISCKLVATVNFL